MTAKSPFWNRLMKWQAESWKRLFIRPKFMSSKLLNRENLFISRHEIEVQVHPIQFQFDSCLPKISFHWNSVIPKIMNSKLLNREDLFISRHEIEVQVHPIPTLTHACLRSLPNRKQCDSCYVLSLKLLNCCGYLFISGHEIKVQVHPIRITTHPCLRSLPIRKQCDSCFVLSLKLVDCCEYFFISGHANKVQVHPIPCLKISFDEDISSVDMKMKFMFI